MTDGRARGALEACAVALLAVSCTTVYSFDTATRPACKSDSDCPVALRCDSASQACVGCTSDLDCSGDSGAGGRCKSSSDHPETNTCVECVATTDCALGRVCDTTTNRCIATCDGDDDDDDETCRALASTCSNGRCLACTGCTSPRYCSSAAGGCVDCRNDLDCTTPSNPHCDLYAGRCVQCLVASDCPVTGTPWCDRSAGQCVAAVVRD